MFTLTFFQKQYFVRPFLILLLIQHLFSIFHTFAEYETKEDQRNLAAENETEQRAFIVTLLLH